MTGTKMKKAIKWDASEHLETEADIAAYLNAALDDIARAKGMTQLAKDTGITRDGLTRHCPPPGIHRLIQFKESLRHLI